MDVAIEQISSQSHHRFLKFNEVILRQRVISKRPNDKLVISVNGSLAAAAGQRTASFNNGQP
ncbi:MAG: hypothetical protein M9927_18535 [Anaerolineae bacterium]|nr:hypothetical protein [Anaerolineae bacterium]